MSENGENRVAVQRYWQRIFRGVTIEGTVEGRWIDDEGGEHFQDQCLKLTVACDNTRLEEAQREVIRIGRRLDQLAMYFEVQYYDGVQIFRMQTGK